jgi:hypothetical protein
MEPTNDLDTPITDIDELERVARINGGATIGVGTVEYLVGRIRAAEAAHGHICDVLETSTEIRSSIEGALSRLHAEKDRAFACDPFAWSDINPVRGTSVVSPSVMLLAPDGHCVGLVTVLQCESEAVRIDLERALNAAGNPAEMRRFMNAARNGEAEANERADKFEKALKFLSYRRGVTPQDGKDECEAWREHVNAMISYARDALAPVSEDSTR